MSKYTTGEMAKLTGTTVRTVQYYDTRNILVPSELSDGGRRLYSEDDLKKLKVICFLRSLDLSIDNISKILSSNNSEKVIEVLLEQQIQALKAEINDRKSKLSSAEQLVKELKSLDCISVQTIQDIAYKMENKNKLRKVYRYLLFIGLIIDAIEIGTLVYGFMTGKWLPFIIGLPIMLGLGIYVSRYYFTNVAYICPNCHEVFQPEFWSAFWAYHTPKTRRLVCPYCKEKNDCIETYNEK